MIDHQLGHDESSAAAAPTTTTLDSLRAARGDLPYLRLLAPEDTATLEPNSQVSVSARFREIVDLFGQGETLTPAGFRAEPSGHGPVEFDLIRDIGVDRGGVPRPTKVLFSADSANPYEIAECAGLIANVTCNPGIVYDLFLNNPAANVGNEFKTLEDVLNAISVSAGPGCDVSVELHDPYETDFSRILDEVAMYEEVLSRHRLVVKVPHTGPLNSSTAGNLLQGDGLLDHRFSDGSAQDQFGGHRLALRLQELGHRVNFTLMFEPYQTALALQSRPYFINAFIRQRLAATNRLRGLVAAYEATDDHSFVSDLREFMIKNQFLARSDDGLDLLQTLDLARQIVRYRMRDGYDGLDSARHSLRWLSASNLPDTRLIFCSMDGEAMFPDIMSLLVEPEFVSLQHRALITTEPRYLARWASSPQVLAYQRRFLTAAGSRV